MSVEKVFYLNELYNVLHNRHGFFFFSGRSGGSGPDLGADRVCMMNQKTTGPETTAKLTVTTWIAFS